MFHAIERTGYGQRARYTVRLYGETWSQPAIPKIYRTEEAARRAAAVEGIEILACGDLYEVRAAYRQKTGGDPHVH